MILFINVFITDSPIPGTNVLAKRDENRRFLNSYTSYDVFKYTLMTLAPAYKWKSAILNIKMDSTYDHLKDDLNETIQQQFKGVPLTLRWNRNESQSEWQRDYDLIDDELIWFLCNHDHPFLDCDSDYLNKIVSVMRNESDTMISSCFTHWPENISYISLNKSSNNIKLFDDYATVILDHPNVDSINIISKKMYHAWWFSRKLPDGMIFPRPDWKHNMLFHFVPLPAQKHFIQYKELCRHFDGYYHLNMHQCPAFDIPDGFFDKKVNLLIGSDTRLDGYTWLNPSIEKYKAEDGVGVDYKWLKKDIPIGWHQSIQSIQEEGMDEETSVRARIQGVIDMMYNHYTEPLSFDITVLNKIFNVWLKPHALSL